MEEEEEPRKFTVDSFTVHKLLRKGAFGKVLEEIRSNLVKSLTSV